MLAKQRRLSCLDKFCLLMWKNFLLTRRNKWQFILEFIVLMLVCCILLSVRIYREIYEVKLKNPTFNEPSIIFMKFLE